MAQSGKVAILKISAQANGSFAAVLRLAEEGKQPFLRTTHTLPAAPKLFQHYQQWQQSYYALGQTSRWRWHRIIVPNYQVLNASKQGDLKHLWERVQLQGDQVETELHQWFEQSSFRDLREDIIGEVRADEPLRLILETDDRTLQRLPWHRWPLLQKRPKAEFVLAAPYRAEKVEDLRSPLKILAILGLCEQLDVETDLKTLQEQFADAQIQCLTNPSLDTLKDALFYGHCDVLLFSGHSQSCDAGDCVAGEMGRSSIFLGDLPVPIVELSAALTAAVCNGLKLAIFNSCDGLGLAQDVSAAKIPNVVVMREPIPDEAAQDFLRYFLQAFQLGNAFHLAVRHARERLRDESQKYPQAA